MKRPFLPFPAGFSSLFLCEVGVGPSTYGGFLPSISLFLRENCVFWIFGAWTGVRPLLTDQKRRFPPQKQTFLRHFAVFFNSFLRKVRFHLKSMSHAILLRLPVIRNFLRSFSDFIAFFPDLSENRELPRPVFFHFSDCRQFVLTLRLNRQGLFLRFFAMFDHVFTPVIPFIQKLPHVRELFVLDDALFSGFSYSIFPTRHQMGDVFFVFPQTQTKKKYLTYKRYLSEKNLLSS